jgi:cytochrome c553
MGTLSRMRLLVAAVGLAGLAAAAVVAERGVADADDGADALRRDVEPFLRQWCFKCHSGERIENDLDMAKLVAAPDGADAADSWRQIRRQLRRHVMPPKKEPQPPGADVAKIVAWIESRTGTADVVDPGRTTLRRLSRFEYRRTVRDLTGVDFEAEARLPANDSAYGFDDIGDVLSVSPALLEKYLAAAEDVASRAIVDEDSSHPRERTFYPDGKAFQFFTNKGAGADVVIPRDGEYVLRARAYAEQAGGEPARMAFQASGAEDVVVDVKALEAKPEVYEARMKLPAGSRHVSVAFVNDYYKPDDPDPANRDRNLFVQWLQFVGPVDVRPVPELQRRMFGDAGHPRDRTAIREALRGLASRAYRRPATDDEVAALVAIVDLAQKRGSRAERGVQLALTAILVSPHFLFRVEIDGAPDDPKAAHDLTDFELASRLSYFLWSTLPDDELTALAAKGALHDPATLAAQAKRMLRDARASALVTNFAAQWLELRRLDLAAPDPERFPEFDEALRAAMRQETEMFVEALVREERPLREFLAADFTFVNERLAKHYGIDGVKGDAFRRVALEGGRRGGLLTQASILTLTSNPTRTSPVKRGKFILEEILAEPPPPPPPGVGTFDESPAAAQATVRERLARHRADPKCAQCHDRMDSLGLALENFDAVGKWRDREGAQKVDASGALPDGRAIEGPSGLRGLLASDDAFARCLASRLVTYAIGRGPTRDDRAAVDRLLDALPGLDATFADLVFGVVKMDGFRRRRGEAR